MYLWNPNISSDQIWVMRRYLPFILPGFVLFAFVVVDHLLDARGTRSVRLATRGSVAALVAAAIAWPIHTDWPVRDDSAQHGFLAPVEELCHQLGPRAAVVILQGGHLDEVLPQTLRSYCNVPVAIGSADKSAVFPLSGAMPTDLAQRWNKTRHRVFLVADGTKRIARIFPGVEPVGRVVAVNTRLLRMTVGDRPHDLVTVEYRFVVVEVPSATGTG